MDILGHKRKVEFDIHTFLPKFKIVYSAENAGIWHLL